MRTAAPIELNPEQRAALKRLARQRSLPARLVERARIVLRAADGQQNQHIATQMGIMPEKQRAGGIAFWRAASPRWKRMLRGPAEPAPSPITA
jgi:FixJ family two-component response regulator